MTNFFDQELHQVASDEGRFAPVRAAIDPRSFYHFRTSQQHVVQHATHCKSISRNCASQISTSI